MTSWHDFVVAQPAFAQQVRTVFDAHAVKVLATLRANGAPRVSGIEVVFEDDEMVFGSMPRARKGTDLRRDPRCALHSVPATSTDGERGRGDVKVAGRATCAGPLSGDGPSGDRFVVDLAEVVWTGLTEAQDELLVRWWTPAEGLQSVTRA